jgi:hypothetical protein
MKAIFKKQMNGIFPSDEDGAKLLQSIPKDGYCLVEYKKNRNYENHKRFFKFIQVAFDNQDFYDDDEQLRKALQMIAGHYEELIIRDKKGNVTTHYIPKSIAFDEMDEAEFQTLFKKCIGAFLSRYGNGLTEQQLMQIINFD